MSTFFFGEKGTDCLIRRTVSLSFVALTLVVIGRTTAICDRCQTGRQIWKLGIRLIYFRQRRPSHGLCVTRQEHTMLVTSLILANNTEKIDNNIKTTTGG